MTVAGGHARPLPRCGLQERGRSSPSGVKRLPFGKVRLRSTWLESKKKQRRKLFPTAVTGWGGGRANPRTAYKSHPFGFDCPPDCLLPDPPGEPLPARGPTHWAPPLLADSLAQAATTSRLHSAMVSWLVVTLPPLLPPIVNFSHSSRNELFKNAHPIYPSPQNPPGPSCLLWGKSQRPSMTMSVTYVLSRPLSLT